ncbi:MAG: phosphatase PAP2 family protein, partial [Anaerolineales bacterium]|nr:phosphatase PAP2 family protein [Anaerolineales bacterium]
MIDGILDNGIQLILWLQGLGDWIIPPMKAFTFLGSENFYFLIPPILFWVVDITLAVRVGMILMLTSILNNLIKWRLHLPRPFMYDGRVQALTEETTFGAPSGHSQTPLSLFGLIAFTVKKRWFWVLTGVVIFFVGISRMVLGVHFHLDVLMGWTLGILGIWLFVRVEDGVKDWYQKFNPWGQVGVALAASFGLILVGVLTLAVFGGFHIPAEWEQNALLAFPDAEFNPFDITVIITPAATLFGLLAGLSWLGAQGGFNVAGVPWKLLLRILVGVVGVVVLWQGLGAVFPRNPDLLSYSLRYLRYGLVGFWISGWAPWLFVRLGLAERAK